MKTSHRLLFTLVALLGLSATAVAQEVGLKSNALYLATSTLNAGMDFRLADHWSASLHFGYNPWAFPNSRSATWADGTTVDANPKMAHFLVMPEVKWWPCRAFERHAIGLHGIYTTYNLAALPFPKSFNDHRYRGDAYGVGLSWGYQWAMGERWGVEFSLGAGYLWTRYTQYEAGACGTELKQVQKGIFAPTKLALNFIYYIK